MLNPVLDKYVLEFSSDFFNTEYIKKYNNYLYTKNYPIKEMIGHIHSNLKSIVVPGWTLPTTVVNNLTNLKGVTISDPPPKNMTETSVNRQYAGNYPLDELFNSKTITITNSSTILNWMYYYEIMRDYYSRGRKVKDFKVFMTIMDQANIPMMQFIFSDCFIISLPDLEFEANMIVKEQRTFDLGIAFNKFDTKFIIPEFDITNKNI